jgi:hypothetical protein
MSKPYFECHITIERPFGEKERLLKVHSGRTGWKTSCIDGDPIMGQRPFFYFTCHDVDFDRIKEKMHAMEIDLRDFFRTPAIRSKIEQIVYDTKTGLV